jgi:hypothetical protein
MSWILIALVIVVLFAVAAAALRKQVQTGGVGFPYRAAPRLFSAAERSFLGVLDQAVGAEHRVFGKVRVADVATMEPGLSRSARQGALNRIAAKHFDYVVCRASDMSIVCAVELNDKSHQSNRARERDAFIAKLCEVIALPLLVVPAQTAYSAIDIRARFLATISPLPHAGDVVTSSRLPATPGDPGAAPSDTQEKRR